MNKILLLPLLMLSFAVCAEQDNEKTIRICDDSGCSERPINVSTTPKKAVDPESERRLAALTEMARKDPRAAYDLGLRYFRGDGVRQDSYQALQWMRDAAERGDLRAQSALGRLYLNGLEEMGSDPGEAERWLSLAASRGDKEANKLLAEAQAAKKAGAQDYRSREQRRKEFTDSWNRGYSYRSYWRDGGWYFY